MGGPRPGGPGYPGAPRLAPTRGPAEPQHHAHASTHRQRPRLPGQGIPQARALRVLSPRHRPDAQHRQPLLAGGRDEEGGVLRRRPADAGAQQPRDRVPRPDPHRPGPHHAGAVRQHARGDPPHRQEAGRAAGRDGHPLRGQPPLRPRGAGPDQAVRDLRLGGGPLPVQAGRRARGADRHGARAAARGADPRGGAGALDRRASPRRPQVDGRALPGRDPALDRRAGRRARPAARGAVLPALPRRQPHRRRAAGPQVRPRRPADLDPAVRPDRQRRRRCRREQAGAPPAAPATEPRPPQRRRRQRGAQVRAAERDHRVRGHAAAEQAPRRRRHLEQPQPADPRAADRGRGDVPRPRRRREHRRRLAGPAARRRRARPGADRPRHRGAAAQRVAPLRRGV